MLTQKLSKGKGEKERKVNTYIVFVYKQRIIDNGD